METGNLDGFSSQLAWEGGARGAEGAAAGACGPESAAGAFGGGFSFRSQRPSMFEGCREGS